MVNIWIHGEYAMAAQYKKNIVVVIKSWMCRCAIQVTPDYLTIYVYCMPKSCWIHTYVKIYVCV